QNLVAWSWTVAPGGRRHVVVVNLSGLPAQARIRLDWPDLPGRSWPLTDILSQATFDRDGAELAGPGLFVDLGPWQYHLLALP
ncbi:MAG: alpha-amylase, partial [Candidatus Dormiibacterota bacterium]